MLGSQVGSKASNSHFFSTLSSFSMWRSPGRSWVVAAMCKGERHRRRTGGSGGGSRMALCC